jgi:hypothetical protein
MQRAYFGLVFLAVFMLVLAPACGGDDDDDEGTAGRGGSSGSSGGTGGGSGSGGTNATGGRAGAAGESGAVDPALEAACTDYCDELVALMCPNDEGATVDDCMAGCLFIGEDEECGELFSDWLDCARTATLECNADEEGAPVGCDTEDQAVIACYEGT